MSRKGGRHPGGRRVRVTDERPEALVAVPVSEMPDPAEGSSRHRADCGHDVWLAPSGRKTLARHGPMLLCSACAEGFLRNDPDIEIGVAPDQLPEIGDELRRRGLLPE